MDFVNINSTYSENSRPRYLTEEEIDKIVDVIPTTYSADQFEGNIIRESIKKDLFDKLTNKKISPEAINQIGNDIVKYYTTSRIAAGFSAGNSAGENSSHGSMQSALNSVAPY